MKSTTATLLGTLLLAACANDPAVPPAKPVEQTFTFTGKVVEKAGRCHTVRTRDGLFALDRGVLRGVRVGAWVRVRAYSARRQSCPNAQRIVVTSLRRIRQPNRARTFNNPRSRGVSLDHCKRYRRQCGRTAALAFCRRNGFRQVAAFSTRPARRTRIHAGGRICRTRGRVQCRRFRVIRCRG